MATPQTAAALRDEADVHPRAQAERRTSDRSEHIAVRGARAHNLHNVDVDFPKGKLTVVTGLSGSGKSSLVSNVLESEATRRYLETLSLYERQSTREGPEAPVDSIHGLGVAITVGPERRLYQRRATVGVVTEIAHHLAILLATAGRRTCLACGVEMVRGTADTGTERWHCPACSTEAPAAAPRHFSPSNYAAACLTCNGVGSLQVPEPDKLIIHPQHPLCAGAMYSPGFFPQGYLGKPFNGGYDIVQGLAARYGFDPFKTPWSEMTDGARQAFLFGDPEPLPVTFHSRKGRVREEEVNFAGFYGWIRDWDVGGTYTSNEPCPECKGARLRADYLAVTLNGHNYHELSQMPLSELMEVLQDLVSDGDVSPHPAALAPQSTLPSPQSGEAPPKRLLAPGQGEAASLRTILHRLRFLNQVGLGYLHLNRVAATLSAGETQRVKLAGLLGSGLTALTVLLDEPTRGLHPAEVDALRQVLLALRAEGNTVIVVEHELAVMRAADHLVDMGPGSGVLGGNVVASGAPDEVANADSPTGRWLREEHGGARRGHVDPVRRRASAWLSVLGPRSNNLCGQDVRLPLGLLVGFCGVSGSGKSTLLVDTVGRALAPRTHTTSVASEPLEPGEHDGIENAPSRTVIVDQAKAGVTNPADYLGISSALRKRYAESDDARALGLDEKTLARKCSTCRGRGFTKTNMGFLPDVFSPCDTCRGTGYLPEAWEVRLHDVSLPELFGKTIDEVHDILGDEERIARPLVAARDVGLGYLVLRQAGHTLSGGEAQRLKIAKELCRRTRGPTFYILDEPTVGQHPEDVARLVGVLQRLVDAGHSVLVVEHHIHLLAACDWLIELGPGGGPDGGRVIAEGSPETVAAGQTPTAPFLRELLEVS